MEYTQFGLNILINTPDEMNFKKWIFRIDCIPHNTSSVNIEDIEIKLNSIFNPYQNKSFKELDCHISLENVTNFFKDKIKDMLNEYGWVLTFIEVSIPPKFTYSINLISHNNNFAKPKKLDSVLYEKPYIDKHTKPLETNNPLCNIMRSTENSVTYSSQISAEVNKIINRMSK